MIFIYHPDALEELVERFYVYNVNCKRLCTIKFAKTRRLFREWRRACIQIAILQEGCLVVIFGHLFTVYTRKTTHL